MLTHSDYWSGNVVWRDGVLTGIVDWSGGARGPRGFDVGWCRLDLYLLFGDSVADVFVAAYGDAIGHPLSDIDLFARRDESSVRVFSVKGLSNSSHAFTIQVTGMKNPESQGNIVVVDAFDVPAPAVSHLQDTDPDISYSAGWTGGDISKPWSGGSATFSTTPGAL